MTFEVEPSPGPLAGIRILDFCHFLAGPYATMVLGELGAEIIKIEDSDRLDEARSLGPFLEDGQSLYFSSLNWGKRSFGVRFADAETRAVIRDLVRSAEVVVDNFRPGVMAKLGLDHASLAAVNPNIISCSITGFGETGPYANRPGYDYTIQALTGVMSMTGEPDGPPGKAGISYVDHSGGLTAALAVSAALVERVRTGRGRHIDLGLLDVQVSMLSYLAAWQLNTGFQPHRIANGAHPSIVPAQTFATNDGHMSIFIGNDAMWTRLVEALDDNRLFGDEFRTNADRFKLRGQLVDILAEDFAKLPSTEWVTLFARHGIPCARVNSLEEALRDRQVIARGLIEATDYSPSGSFRHVRGPVPSLAGPGPSARAPMLGTDTRQILSDIGYAKERIDELAASGSIIDVSDRAN